MTATIPGVPRPRGDLTDDELYVVANLQNQLATAQADYREYCVMLLTLRGRSFSEVSKATGLSTNTLQRWKRESSS